MRILYVLPFAALALSACASDTAGYDPTMDDSATDFGEATLTGASGAAMGNVTFNETPEGVRVVINGRNMPPGVHGAHVHMTGACQAPDFESAGGHWNPLGKMHGRDNPAGPHMGDMPNLIVGNDGSGTLELVIQGATLVGGAESILDADGAAILIHQGPDDYRTDPSGASGARIACGVIAAG